jgi:hypothetical protein
MTAKRRLSKVLQLGSPVNSHSKLKLWMHDHNNAMIWDYITANLDLSIHLHRIRRLIVDPARLLGLLHIVEAALWCPGLILRVGTAPGGTTNMRIGTALGAMMIIVIGTPPGAMTTMKIGTAALVRHLMGIRMVLTTVRTVATDDHRFVLARWIAIIHAEMRYGILDKAHALRLSMMLRRWGVTSNRNRRKKMGSRCRLLHSHR